MAEKQGAGKGKKGRKIGNNKEKCAKYRARGKLELNKELKKEAHQLHLDKALARKAKAKKDGKPKDSFLKLSMDKRMKATAKLENLQSKKEHSKKK